MQIEIGFTPELTNTRYAPLAVLGAYYRQAETLHPLQDVQMNLKTRDFSPTTKLIQVLISLLAGCTTLAEVNTKLKAETQLAHVWGWPRVADQSSLSRTLDALSLTHLDQLRRATTRIWRARTRLRSHDWRAFVWLDFDLSGLPCSAQAQASHKGYFGGKKTCQVANWRARV